VVLNVCADLDIKVNSVENVSVFYVYLLSFTCYCRSTNRFTLFSTKDGRNSELE
jgi:hypothetical protein